MEEVYDKGTQEYNFENKKLHNSKNQSTIQALKHNFTPESFANCVERLCSSHFENKRLRSDKKAVAGAVFELFAFVNGFARVHRLHIDGWRRHIGVLSAVRAVGVAC